MVDTDREWGCVGDGVGVWGVVSTINNDTCNRKVLCQGWVHGHATFPPSSSSASLPSLSGWLHADRFNQPAAGALLHFFPLLPILFTLCYKF